MAATRRKFGLPVKGTPDPVRKAKKLPNARTGKVAKVAAKVTARSGKTGAAATQKARSIIKARKSPGSVKQVSIRRLKPRAPGLRDAGDPWFVGQMESDRQRSHSKAKKMKPVRRKERGDTN